MILLSLIYILIPLSISPASARNQLTFPGLDLPQSYKVGFNPRSVGVGDFNGDGIKDIAVGNFESNFISVFFGLGGGVFSTARNITVGLNPSLGIGDLNRDGKSDIVVLTGNPSLKAFLGTANNDFVQSFAYNVQEFFSVNSIAVNDFDNDGNTDVLVNGNIDFGANVFFFRGKGDGTFAQSISSLSNGCIHLSVADFNNDNNLDIVGARINSNPFIQFGDGVGRFSTPVSIGDFSGSSSSTTGDFNGDGKTDVAVTSVLSGVGIFLGNGNGTFTLPPLIPMEPSRRIVTGDFNSDGKIDLALTNDLLNAVSVLLGDGMGNFTLEEKYKVGQNPWGIAVADFNDDNTSDLVVTNSRFNLTTVALNTISVLSGNGNGRFIAARRYGDIRASSAVIADFNKDGLQDIAIGDETTNEIAVSHGPWNGAFDSLVRTSVGAPFQIVATADFNNDAKTDLVIQTQSGVLVLLGRGNGYFRRWTSVPNTGRTFVKDFNNDNNADLAFFSSTKDNFVKFTLRFGSGNGKFSNLIERIFPIYSFNYVSYTADLNNDGLCDLVIADSTSVNAFLGNGDGTFGDPIVTNAEEAPRSIAVADFNGDQVNDLLLGTFGHVALLLGGGNGSFNSLIRLDFNSFETAFKLHVADFNNDNRPDFAATVDDSTLFFVGDGIGGFTKPIRRVKGLGALGDINGDNRIDSVYITEPPSSGGIVVSLNRF